eukprot:TRINITY_DN60927_c0_g1_i1.p1 TRINITY_DN60927_c0_g1~~TRINITY_DN60927_c0_g1_i1.p1  ORF type:complete len:616 (+),score=104.51 TRINITY_DN60927_c0_g1_i1:29-1849(+)
MMEPADASAWPPTAYRSRTVGRSCWSHRGPSEATEPRAAWTASYKEAARVALQQPVKSREAPFSARPSIEGVALGNPDRRDMFRNFDDAARRIEVMRLRCRDAAACSAARGAEERPDMRRFHENVSFAKELADIGRDAPVVQHRGLDERTPLMLGHLNLPSEAHRNRETLPDIGPSGAPSRSEFGPETDALCRSVGFDGARDRAASANKPYRGDGTLSSVSTHFAPSRPWSSELECSRSTSATIKAPLEDPIWRVAAANTGIATHVAELKAEEGQDGIGRVAAASKDMAVHMAKLTVEEGQESSPQHDDAGPIRINDHSKDPYQLSASKAMQELQQRWSEEKVEQQETHVKDADDDSSESTSVASMGDSIGWPPRAPLLRFKVLTHFSGRYQNANCKLAVFQEANKNQSSKILEVESKELTDVTIAWFNFVFVMDLKTEHQLLVFFPIMLLFILDATFRNKVPWWRVDWHYQYKRALNRNFTLLEHVWEKVGMEKFRAFRVEHTEHRIEKMLHSSIQEKLQILAKVRYWFEAMRRSDNPYDPLIRRKEIFEKCLLKGYAVEFPPWVTFDKDRKLTDSRHPETVAFDQMPEYKRLAWFLGDTAMQGL